MKFSEWIKLRELMAPAQTQAGSPASPSLPTTLVKKENPKADLDNIRSIAQKSRNNKELASGVEKYFKGKAQKATDASGIVQNTATMYDMLSKIPK